MGAILSLVPNVVSLETVAEIAGLLQDAQDIDGAGALGIAYVVFHRGGTYSANCVGELLKDPAKARGALLDLIDEIGIKARSK